MLDVIFAQTGSNGIGFRGGLPWNIKEAFIFRTKTMGHNLIIGRKTFESLPAIHGRTIIVISKTMKSSENVLVFPTIDDAIAHTVINSGVNNGVNNAIKTFIAGGGDIYNTIFKKYPHLISRVHKSLIKGEYECDTFIDFPMANYNCVSTQDFDTFIHYEYVPNCHGETQYINLLRDVYYNGQESEGRNGTTRSKFSNNLKFDLREGFPLLTTKRMFFRGIVEELLFFLRGDTDSKILEEKGINIWKPNTSVDFLKSCNLDYKEGEMGPMYGYQWRFFMKEYKPECKPECKPEYSGVDQLLNVIKTIKENPKSRRIIMTSFNPAQVDQGVLYPCHSIVIQFFVENGYLDMYCYNRSSDLFLGLPFNIASSSLLQTLVAMWTGLVPRYFNLSLGDCHIYSQHFEAVETQLKRVPRKFPTIDTVIDSIEKLEFENFKLCEYTCYPSIKAEMVA